MPRLLCPLAAAVALLPFATDLPAQSADTAAYGRAAGLRGRFENLVRNIAGPPNWLPDGKRFWYRVVSGSDTSFILVDPETGTRRPVTQADGISTRPVPAGGAGRSGTFAPAADSLRHSPDSQWVAIVRDGNIQVRRRADSGYRQLSRLGQSGNPYTLQSLVWSPDSRRIAANRVQPGYRRTVTYVESSPSDQLQPRTFERVYTKPGDQLDVVRPSLFDVAAGTETVIDDSLFPHPYALSRLAWWKDSRGFTFEYNQRGHQILRIVEVDAATGAARALITDSSDTFINYRRANGSLNDSGRGYRLDLNDGEEIIWASERDGWAHLYLHDGRTGKLKRQITSGDWLVRAVVRVDEERRQIYFMAGGIVPGQDPYFAQYYRIGFDGTGLVPLTDADGNHAVSFSPSGRYYVDTWSRADLPPVMVLRRTADAAVIMELERGDDSALRSAGWTAPEVFVAKGRDGKTDIWGVIFRPTDFDPSKKYPVIENIYAGPQGSFVPKNFSVHHGMRALAELGFIVVQIDGMGTNNRSKAFHDVAWRNLSDAGFPDRILWHRAVAAKYPSHDLARGVGIYGGSAGGQNAMGALLFHPEFYTTAVAFAGAHDNRIDKIWWNEHWMGWPIGPQYAASSNVDNAHRLQGNLLLVTGELDTNVDPSSTMQVVNALVRAGKYFDLLVIPGEDHQAGRGGRTAEYGERKLWDFFVRHLQGAVPPNRNATIR